MKTLNIIFLITSIMITSARVNAQDGKLNFDSYITGKYYRVVLTNGMEVNGKLIKVNDVSIELKTESKNVRIKKKDISEISDSYAFFGESKPDTNLNLVHLKDGSEFIGHVVSEDSLHINFETLSGTKIDIKRNQIEEIKTVRSDYAIGEDPNQSRLFLAPTGKNLKGGTGYFSINELLFPMLAFGITDYFTLAGGISILPGSSDQLYYINGKARAVHVKNFDLSAGVLYTNITGAEESGLTLIYGNGTYGTNNASVTIGAGLSFSNDNNSGNYPLLILGGDIKISNSLKFITENWISTSPESAQIFSFGIRFFGRSLAGDFGLIHIRDGGGDSAIEGWPFFPWIGLNYNFDL